LRPETQLHDILAAQWLADVVEMHGLWFLGRIIGIGGWVYGELLVMAESVDGALGEEACVVDGAMVDNLHEGFVFVCDGRVVDVDESVCAAG
jgi:hypothetical protein